MNDLSEVAIDTVSCDSNTLWCWFSTNVQTNMPVAIIPIKRTLLHSHDVKHGMRLSFPATITEPGPRFVMIV
jgi:hypothetical protein